MIIEYKDGTRVVLQLGDMYGDPSITTVCWIEISGVLARSPFKTISATKNYLLSLTSAADIDFYHIPEEFQKDLTD